MKGIFITGTGTDVGKTFISALIVKKLRKVGLKAGYYKAALSGAEKVNGNLVPGDAAYVCKISGLDEEYENMVSFIYETPVSPHLAAKKEGNPLTLEKIIEDFEDVKSKYEFITVEGSGGIVCPLRRDDKTIMLTDVIKSLNLDVIIVASAKLGTINSTVLTVEYAKSHGITVKGIILNDYDKDNFMHNDNMNEVEDITGIPVIACVPPNSVDIQISTLELEELFKEI